MKFRFLGKLMAKAIMDFRLVSLGWFAFCRFGVECSVQVPQSPVVTAILQSSASQTLIHI